MDFRWPVSKVGDSMTAPPQLYRPIMLSEDRRMRVLRTAAALFHVHPNEILGRDRHQTIALARHVAAYLFRCDGLSYPEIGREMGRDHTTVMSGIKRIAAIVAAHHPETIAVRVHLAEIELGHTRPEPAP